MYRAATDPHLPIATPFKGTTHQTFAIRVNFTIINFFDPARTRFATSRHPALLCQLFLFPAASGSVAATTADDGDSENGLGLCLIQTPV